MSRLGDPLLAVKSMLESNPAVQMAVGGRIYATPVLPVEREFPCIQLEHIASQDYAPVAFRHSYTAIIQLSVWSTSHSESREIGNIALDAVHRVPPAGLGVVMVRPTNETEDLFETLQPLVYRYRSDLQVRVVAQELATPKSKQEIGA